MSEENTFNPIEGSEYPNLFLSAIINILIESIYNDEYINCIQNGSGEFIHKNGMKTIGEFTNGKPNGFGKSYYPDGSLFFEGEFKDGKRNGSGKLYSKNGKVLYDGNWKDGKRNSLGKEYHENKKIRYEGYFKDGKRNGFGKGYRPDGSLEYEGNWKDRFPSNETN